MAISVASLRPIAPNILMYPYEIISMSALPKGAAEIACIAFSPPIFINGFPGKKGAK